MEINRPFAFSNLIGLLLFPTAFVTAATVTAVSALTPTEEMTSLTIGKTITSIYD